MLIEDDDWFLEVARYIHLNPVREAGAIHDAAAGGAVSDFGRRLREDQALREQFREIQEKLLKYEI